MNHQNCHDQAGIILTEESIRLFDLIPSPVAVVGLNKEIVYANAGVYQLAQQIRHGESISVVGDMFSSEVGQAIEQFIESGVQLATVSLSTSVRAPSHSPSLLQLSRHGSTFLPHQVICLVFQEIQNSESAPHLPEGFLGGLIQHLRNPVFAMSSTLDALVARFGMTQDQEPFLAVLRAEQRRLVKMMQEILEFESPLPVEFSEIPFLTTLQVAIDHCLPVASEHTISLELAVSDDLPSFQLDSQALQQAWILLIEGAIRASAPTQKVIVRAYQENFQSQPGVTVEFLDHGVFLKDGNLARFCEPFVSKRCGESGLGFAIVKHIVDAHFGKLEAANLPGGFVQIKVWLPVKREPSTHLGLKKPGLGAEG
ncbi:MAG: HAMP domain-containing histidine kinase [Acidobacteria bacterium]|nr:HAMP domain-containing histidine kinase [Acidobacteriota bacterium]